MHSVSNNIQTGVYLLCLSQLSKKYSAFAPPIVIESDNAYIPEDVFMLGNFAKPCDCSKELRMSNKQHIFNISSLLVLDHVAQQEYCLESSSCVKKQTKKKTPF